jgi:predicted Zn-dependent protease with MMP-like domain
MGFLGGQRIRKFHQKRSGKSLRPRRGFSRGKRFFEKYVREAVDSLPGELKKRLENVAIIVEEESPSFSKERKRGGHELLGLYHGISKKDRGFWYGNVLPDRIIIYRRPLERISSGLLDLEENIRQTVFHEVGHYFGFDEEELRSLERNSL